MYDKEGCTSPSQQTNTIKGEESSQTNENDVTFVKHDG